MHQWRVQLIGDDSFLQELAAETGTATAIERTDNKWFLKSTDYSDLQTAKAVRDHAISWITNINAIATLFGFSGQIEIANVEGVVDNVRTVTVFADECLGISDSVLVLLQGTEAKTNLGVAKLAALSDDKAKEIFGYLQPLDWLRIRKILEVINADAYTHPIIDEELIKRLYMSANNAIVSGNGAVHSTYINGKKARAPRQLKPVAIGEAQRHIRVLVRDWLLSKI